VQLAQENYGIGYQELTQPLVDTSNYLTPVTGQMGVPGFNSVVNSPTSMQLQNCLGKSLSGSSNPMRLRLFPNPTSTTINIELIGSNDMKSHYRILDATGKLILKGEATTSNVSVDVSSLENGLYFFVIEGNGRTPIVEQFVRR
jgi:hypothetical protein